MDRDDSGYEDELFEHRHRQRMHGRLMQMPPGHPDAGDLEDALEEMEDGDELA